jgi:hypothetical protein
MRLLLVLLAALAVSVQGQYRANCPPTNYTAITSTMNLAALPPNGKYAICRPVGSDDTEPIEFTVSTGVFRLRNSQLLVDNEFSIKFNYPAYPDFSDSAITGFPAEDADGNAFINDGTWLGISMEGAPDPDARRRRSTTKRYPYPYPSHHYVPTTGNCGRMENVNIDDVDPESASSNWVRCDGRTTIKKYSAFRGDSGMRFEDCNGVVAYDISVAGFFDGGDADETDYDGVLSVNSNVSLIRPFIYAQDNGVDIQSASHVTLCNPFINAGYLDVVSRAIRMGNLAGNVNDPPVAVAVAGGTNLFFPGDVGFRDNTQGLLAILENCPSKLAPSYSMKTWKDFITP